MQPELLPVPPNEKTDSALKVRIDRLYRIHGQDWRSVFGDDAQDEAQSADESDSQTMLPWWLLRRFRQVGGSELREG